MDLFRNMELFVEVAKAGGFRAAAERLSMPNSTLSRRIAELEADLGLRLFNRTTRRVELTEAGRVYFERCRRIIDEAHLAHGELSGMIARPTGLIRASVPVDFTVVYLSEILADFLRDYDGISLNLDVSPRQSSLIADPLDLVIRIGEPKDQQLIARKLCSVRVALYAAPDYLLTRGAPTSPQDLVSHNCLRITEQPLKLVHAKSDEVVTVAPTGSVTANNISLLAKLTLAGVGIAALNDEFVSEDLRAGRLVRVLPEWRPAAIPVYILTETRLLPAKVRVFIDFLIDRLKGKFDLADISSSPQDGQTESRGPS